MSYQLDDIWIEKFKNTNLTLTQKRRLYRVIMVFTIGIFYSFDSIFLYLFYKVGTIDITVVHTFNFLAISHVIIFSTIQWFGFSEKFKNPHLTIWQMIFGISIQIICINIEPVIMAYFLALIFIIFSFAIMRITLKESLFIWLLVTCAIALNFYFVDVSKIGIPTPTMEQKIIILLSFSSILLRIILLGYYNTLIKQRLFLMNIDLEKETKYDSLTNIYNRKTILDYHKEFINLCKRKQNSFCIVMLDLDHFKNINDNYGHQVGDVILYETAQLIKENIRNIDKIGRYGGEEFLLLLQSNNIEEGMILVERIRMNLANKKWDILKNEKITISCGLCFITNKNIDDNTIQKADLALYKAKSTGRNKLICFEDL